MRNRYLEILQLQPGATKQDVKVAYRRLSKEYHPDRNSSQGAAEKFLAIHEAYRFLSEVGPSPQKEKVTYNYDPHKAAYEEQRRRAYEFARNRAREERNRQDRIMATILRYFNLAAIGIGAFNALLALDFLLAPKEFTQRVLLLDTVNLNIRGSVHQYDDIRFEDFRMRVGTGETYGIHGEEEAVVEASPLFRVPIRARVALPEKTLVMEQRYSVFRVLGYIIPAMGVLLLLYYVLIKDPDRRLAIALLMTVLFFIQLFLFFRY